MKGDCITQCQTNNESASMDVIAAREVSPCYNIMFAVKRLFIIKVTMYNSIKYLLVT